MPDTIKTGSILIKEGTLLPEAPRFESEPYVPGWRFVKNLDGYGLDRKIHEAGWTFFCLAGEIKATVFGFDGQKTVRRAVKRILGKLKSEKFNCLEIMQVATKRFLGVPYASVSARSRHIQESMFLFRAKDLQKWGPSKIGGRLGEVTGLTSGEEPRQEEMITQLRVATILNL